MYLHIRLRRDGNGSVYAGTPDELKKRYAAIRRRWDSHNPAPFETSHYVEVGEIGSRYYLQGSTHGKFYILEHGKYCPQPTGYSYDSFALALNRLCKLMPAETET